MSPQAAPPVRVPPLRKPDAHDAAEGTHDAPDRPPPHPTPYPADPLRSPNAGTARTAAATAMQQGRGNAATAQAVEGPMDAFWGPLGYDPTKPPRDLRPEPSGMGAGAGGAPGPGLTSPTATSATATTPGAHAQAATTAGGTPPVAGTKPADTKTEAPPGKPGPQPDAKTTADLGGKGPAGKAGPGGGTGGAGPSGPTDAFFGAAGMTAPPPGVATAAPTTGTDADVESPQAWVAGVKTASQTMPRPALPGGAGAIPATGKAVAQKGEDGTTAIATAGPKLVPPAPKVAQPLPPPPDPVPEATDLVKTSAGKKLDALELPPFKDTPRGTKPEIPARLAPQAPPPPPAPPPTKTVPGASAVAAAKQQAQQAQQEADKKPLPAEGATEAPKFPIRITDEREKSFTLPRPLSVQVGEVIADVLQNPGAVATAALTEARLRAYPGGIPDKTMKELGTDDLLPRLTTTVTEKMTALAQIAGIGAEELQLGIAERRMQLEEAKAKKDNVTDAAADKARADARAAAQKKLTTIATQQRAADAAAEKRLRAAAWSTDPKVIDAVRDDLITRLQADAAKARASHKRAGEDRATQLTGWEGIYSTAYRNADDKDVRALNKGTGLTVNKEGGRPWLTVRLEEVTKDFAAKRKDAATASTALQEDAGKAGANAVDLVREWHAKCLKLTRDQKQVNDEAATDKVAQTKADTQAWADLQAEEARNALIGDLLAVRTATKNLRDEVDAAAITYDKTVTDQQKAATKRFFGETGKVSPLTKLAANVQARFVAGEVDGLKKELRDKVDKTVLTDKNLDTVGVLVWGTTAPSDVERADHLKTALSKLDTDEATVYAMLSGLTPRQIDMLHVRYKMRWGLNLTDHIFKEMKEDEAERDRAMQLLKGDPVAIAASQVHEGISGLGTNKTTVTSALRGKSPEELKLIAEYYKKHYDETIEEAIEGDFSGKEKQSVLALAAGDVPRADAIALDDASRSFWGKDLAAIRATYKTIRDEVTADVQKNHPDWTTAQVQAEVARRNAEVDAKYTKEFGAEVGGAGTYDSPLKKVFAENLGKEGNDLAVALADVDPVGEDAARLVLTGMRREVGEDTSKSILADPYQRSLEAVRRDEGSAIRKDLRAKAQAKHPNIPLSKDEERQLQRDIDTEIEAHARVRSKTEMDAVKGRFDAKYSREWGGTEDQPGVYGGLQTMLEQTTTMENDRNEVIAWVTQGYLTPEQHIRFSVEEYGTDEDRIKKTFRGKSLEEINAIKKAYKDKWGEDLDKRLNSELDGRDLFDVQELMRGEPETPEQRIEAARRRYNYEKTNYPGVRWFNLADDERAVLDMSMADAERTYAQLGRKDISADERERLEAQLGRHTAGVDSAVEAYRAGVDRVVDTAVQVVGIAVAIIVGAIIEVASAGTATPVLAALAMSIWGTAATIATKAILLGGAYGLEDLGVDLAIGVVDAIVAMATAGLGNKLLGIGKAAGATKAPGLLARGYAAGGVRKVAAKAVTHVIEQTAQALPTALAGNLLNDDNYRGNNAFSKIVKGTLIQTAHSIAMATALSVPQQAATKGLAKVFAGVGRSIGALRNALGGKPPMHEVNLPRATSANPKERWAAWKEFQERYPGTTREDFTAAVERGQTAANVRAETERVFQREARRQMLEYVPPELRGKLADTPIRVLTEAEFKALGKTDVGQAFVDVVDGKRVIIMHENTPAAKLREEGVHLWQAIDPETVGRVAKLDERVAKWDTSTVAEKIDGYQNKMGLEIDAQRRIQAELTRRLSDPSISELKRGQLLTELEASRRTSEVLGERLREVNSFTPADISAMADGTRKLPQYLDQPARLFNKGFVAGELELREIWRSAEGGERWYVVGTAYEAETPSGNKRTLRNVVVAEPGKPPRLVVEVLRSDGVWAQHGSLNTYQGAVGEAASKILGEREARAAAKRGELHVPVPVQTTSGAGFDQPVLIFGPDGKARIRIREVKHYNDRYIPSGDLTAINDNFKNNRDALLKTLQTPEKVAKLGLTPAQAAEALRAIAEGRFDVELRLGPTTWIGDFESGTILNDLQRRLRQGYGKEVNVLEPTRLSEKDIAAGAKKVEESGLLKPRFEDRVALLAVTPTGITAESLREAQALAKAEVAGVVKGPVSRDPTGTKFYDADKRPVEPVRLSRAGFDAEATAKGLLDRINRSEFLLGSRIRQDRVRVALDLGDLTAEQRKQLTRELARQAKNRGLTTALKERLSPAVPVPVAEIPE